MSTSDTLLVVGADGLLGGSLVARARAAGQPVHGTTLAVPPSATPDLGQLDLGGSLSAWRPPAGVGSAVLCAAITSLDACKRDPAGTRRINVEQTLELARRLVEAGIHVTFISSNLVFDGSEPRQAADAPLRPRTEYGRQKAEVEVALRELSAERTAVVRLTKVLHAGWPLVRGWLDRLRAGEKVEAFADFVCSPIPLACVVRGLDQVAREKRAGVWQFSAEADLSYADLARCLARRLGVAEARVEGVVSEGRVALEHHPRHTTLDPERAERELGLRFPSALAAVEQVYFA